MNPPRVAFALYASADPVCHPADEPRPQDFHALFRREPAMSIAAMQKATLRQALHHKAVQKVLALVVALAMITGIQIARGPHGAQALAATLAHHSAPADPDADNEDGAPGVAPMPFERAGDSFPGSAYYYLAADGDPQTTHPLRHALADLMPGAHWDDGREERPAVSSLLPNSGPAARALAQVNSLVDRTRALSCLTAAIYYEAASEPDAGQRAVAQVVLNRVAHPSFPKTVCGVVFQGSERNTGCQFTFTCDGALARHPAKYFWDRAETVARAALGGYVYEPVGLATHYHTFAVHPYWDSKLNFIGQIGAHRFYRFLGPAGTPAAFRFAYAGGEPLAMPHGRNDAAATRDDNADPVAQAHAYEASLHLPGASATLAPHPATMTPAATAAPAYTAEVLRRGGDAAYRAANLPGGETGVRSEFQNSGNWISEPQ